jgi:uncharacterized protein with HEPN domain
MSTRPDDLYLGDIIEVAAEIEEFIAGIDEASFVADKRTRRAVIQCLSVIGEATARISKELKARYPEVAWRQATDLRNFVIHEYFVLDWKTIWVTVNDDVPALARQVTQIQELEFPV